MYIQVDKNWYLLDHRQKRQEASVTRTMTTTRVPLIYQQLGAGCCSRTQTTWIQLMSPVV